ncbi:MAG TPA: LppX_LprAFG lipoprotein [Vicinamibacterales bacterium]|jgi:hypothetical protein|nr:LppX_LprAFG lipoprotein [Vicinamibacterales bacterium]
MRILPAALLVVGLAAPAATIVHAQGRAQAGAGTAQASLNRTADAILALKSTRFTLKREGTPAFLDEKNGITFTQADCLYSAPDRVSCDVKVSLKNGTIVQLTRVWVPEGTFQTNPLTKQWAKVPPDANFNGALLFARTGIPDILRTGVQKQEIVASVMANVAGQRAQRIKGEVRGDKLTPLVGATLKADAMYPVELWLDEKTGNPIQLHVSETDANGWLIQLSNFNEPVNIPTPQLPPPAGR